ncbi:Exopolyphosphatase [Planctomycetes bacterium Poly30]|uniref:Exopolyphosphatase n=1 Tax=Saltatorellus ferox TaxID=2528018 RepID=A0A518EYD1_9BACT|nr:Exopolyphosphatase [Planctomycetes bacterium Poly30]
MRNALLDQLALAAVDLGSNSFHLVVAREIDGRPHVIDKLRERVALAEGLQPGRGLDTVVQARALDTLERFGERLKVVPQHRIRAVGTATFRRVRDGGAFLRLASEALGAPIEVLPGREEARLVYLGVAQDLGDTEERRLVVDIGGGSTECMIGTRFACHSGDSLTMGCVTWSKRFFPGGRMTAEAFAQAELAARVELEPIAQIYHSENWEHAVGSSGTIRAVGAILEGLGITGGEITRSGLKKLKAKLIEIELCDHLELVGMRPDRRHVLAGGVAVLRAVFKSLGIESMTPSAGALREGVLHDHLGRIHHEDVREASALAFMERMGLDTGHGRRCRETAESLFDQVAVSLGLQPTDRTLLGLAALLHTIGLMVSHAGYHKHGAYLAENADLAGFSRQDRQQLAVLIRGQRRRLRPDLLAGQPRDRMHALRCLLPLLRIALRLRRDRTNRQLPPIQLRASGSRFHLKFPEGWLALHPLTSADLVREAQQLDAFGIVLAVK